MTAARHRGAWRGLALHGTAAALVLLGLTATLYAAWGDGRSGRGAPGAPPPAALAPEADAITGLFRRHALNALLVPLLDDDAVPRWTDIGLHLLCGPHTRVEVDGRPLVPGVALPARAFTLHWHIDQCWPLDYAAFALSGSVVLQVFHEETSPGQLGAIVDARRLRIATAKGTGSVDRPFVAAMALDSDAAAGAP